MLTKLNLQTNLYQISFDKNIFIASTSIYSSFDLFKKLNCSYY